MENLSIFTYIIIAANVIFSLLGFRDHGFFERYLFRIRNIRQNRDYKRIVTSGFLHVGWPHLLFNMITIYSFGSVVELYAGILQFLVIYVVSLIGGSLLSLLVHRNDPHYSAVGASGAACGLIFAAIAIFPGMRVSLFFLPVYVESWVFALIFLALTFWGVRSRWGNIGHDAHLGGAIMGMLTAIAFFPETVKVNYLPVALVLGPSVLFMVLLVRWPNLLYFKFGKRTSSYTVDDRYNEIKKEKELTLDAILDKISQSGVKSLSKREKEILDRYSGKGPDARRG